MLCCSKIPDVVRNDHARLTRDGHLDNHVIVGVGEQRTPKKVYLLPYCHGAQVVDESFHVARALSASEMPKQSRLVLSDERHRYRYLEQTASNTINNFE